MITNEALLKRIQPDFFVEKNVVADSLQAEGNELDDWRWLAGDEKCWLQREAKKAAIAKKKIIFSFPFVKNRILSDFELNFFDCLLGEFKDHVYLWPGSKQPFLDCQPVKNPEDFWQNLSRCGSESKEKVLEQIDKEGLNVDDYYVIDSDEYKSLITSLVVHQEEDIQSHIIEQVETLDFFDLPADMSFEELEKRIDVKAVTSIKLTKPTIEQLRFVLQFPNLQSVHILHADAHWLQDEFFKQPNLQHLNIEIEAYGVLKEWNIPSDFCHKLSLMMRCYDSGNIDKQDKQAIQFVPRITDDKSSGSTIKEFSLCNNYEKKAVTVDLSPLTDLEKLEEKNRSLSLRNQPIASEEDDEEDSLSTQFFGIENCKKLKEISIKGKSSISNELQNQLKINAELQDQLKRQKNFHFEVPGKIAEDELNKLSLEDFENLIVDFLFEYGCENQEPSFGGFKNLRHLTLNAYSRDSGITIKTLPPEIERLDILAHCIKLEENDLSRYKKLKKWCQKEGYFRAQTNSLLKITQFPPYLESLEMDTESIATQDFSKYEQLTEMDLDITGPCNINMFPPFLEKLKLFTNNLVFDPGIAISRNDLEMKQEQILASWISKLEKNSHLKRLEIFNRNSIKVNEEHLRFPKSLEELHLQSFQNIKKLSLIDCPNLKKLTLCGNSKLEELILPPDIEELEISGTTALSKIDLSAYPKLKKIKIDCKPTVELILPKKNIIESLEICSGYKNIVSNLPYCQKVRNMKLMFETSHFNRSLTTDFSACQNLQNLEITNYPRKELDISNLSHLMSVTFSKNTGQGVGLSFNQLPALKSIQLKGDKTVISDVFISGCPDLRMCSTDFKKNTSSLNLHGAGECRHLKCIDVNHKVFNSVCSSEHTYSEDEYDKDNNQNEVNNLSHEVSFQLQQQNEASNVTLISGLKNIRHKIKPDGYTALNKESYQAQGALKAVVYAKNNIVRDYYHLETYDRIAFDEYSQSLSFENARFEMKPVNLKVESFSEQTFKEIYHEVMQTEKDGLGYLSGTLQADDYYPLVMSSRIKQEDLQSFYCDPENAVSIFYVPEKEQFFIKVNQSAPVKICYRYKQTPVYTNDAELRDADFKMSKTPLLDKALCREIESFLQDQPKLKFLFLPDTEVSLKEKIKKLIEYCTFNPPVSTNENIPQQDSDLELLMEIISKRQGACRHRAEAFMLLAHYLNVPVEMIRNEQHQFIEIPYLNAQQKEVWRRVDLGGHPVKDLTPLDVRSDEIISGVKEREEKRIAEKIQKTIKQQAQAQAQRSKPFSLAEEAYYKQFQAKAEPKIINDLYTLATEKPAGFPPIIELLPDQNPLTVAAAIAQSLEKKDADMASRFLYIHDPKELAQYFKPNRLENNQRLQVDGPLKKLFAKGGTVVMNWSTFTPGEKASYQSILETEPMLMGEAIHPNLRIISLLSSHSVACSAFMSRGERCRLADGLLSDVKPKEENVSENPLIVDLHGGTNWRAALYGKIRFQGEEIKLTKGKLLKAIEQKRPLHILNPPKNDDEWNVLLYRLRYEHQFLRNGQMEKTHSTFSITTNHQEKVIRPNIEFIKSTENHERIYLGIHNLHECYKKFRVKDDHQAETLSDLLKDYAENQVFYITSYIPEADWRKLLARIQEKYPNKKFTFALAPGAEIEHVQKGEMASQENKSSYIKISNDPDYAVMKLAEELKKAEQETEEEPIIIDVTPQTTAMDLLGAFYYDEKKSTAEKAHFEHKQGLLIPLLTSKGKKKIILNGPLSLSVYQQLLPIFDGQSSLNVNGQKETIHGKLFSVQPISASDHIPALYYDLRTYDVDAYREDLVKDQEDNLLLNKLEKFYHLAAKIPTKGVCRPEKPEATHHHLKRLLSALKRKENLLHPHNPIKGLFHYDYLKGGEDYAYLNVVAKYLFDDYTTTAPFNVFKLKRLLFQYSIQKAEDLAPHLWKILNCWKGQDLKKMLGDDFLSSLMTTSGYPELPKAQLAMLWSKWIEPYKSQSNGPIKNYRHVAKRNQQLYYLIENHAPFILLKGAPGVGKTETIIEIRKLFPQLKISISNGMDDIEAWLTDTDPETIKVLLLDEANCADPGTFDFLKGLGRDSKTIFYRGKSYTLTEKHTVIVPCNNENYSNRHYHPLFQRYAETVHFEMPDQDFLEKNVLKNLLRDVTLNDESIIKDLITGFHFIREFNSVVTYSIRDLKNLAQRFILLLDHQTDTRMQKSAVFHAVLGEFAGNIRDPMLRDEFIKKLKEKLTYAGDHDQAKEKLLKIDDQCFIPQEKEYVVAAIKQGLQLRAMAMETALKGASSYYHKTGLLLDGESGFGKSTVLEKMLEANGLSRNAKETEKKYYKVSVSKDNNIAEILLRAYAERSVVILDELNAIEDDALTGLLNQLLTNMLDKNTEKKLKEIRIKIAEKEFPGVDPESMVQTPILPGFMVFATKNPSYRYADRKATSAPLSNRMMMVYADDYSKEALIDIAQHYKKPNPEDFVSAYLRSRAEAPQSINMRTFYQLVKEKNVLSEEKVAAQILVKKESVVKEESPLSEKKVVPQLNEGRPKPASENMIQKIKDKITLLRDQLKLELQSRIAYPNKKRKKIKVTFLNAILEKLNQKNIPSDATDEALKGAMKDVIESVNTEQGDDAKTALRGKLSNRVSRLITSMQNGTILKEIRNDKMQVKVVNTYPRPAGRYL